MYHHGGFMVELNLDSRSSRRYRALITFPLLFERFITVRELGLIIRLTINNRKMFFS